MSAEDQAAAAAAAAEDFKKKHKTLINKIVKEDEFNPGEHFYTRVLNAAIHPMVASFLKLGNKRIVERYVHLNPNVDAAALKEVLCTEPKIFKWSGADLFNCTTADGSRKMVIVETNSCPSGNKSMPPVDEHHDYASYEAYITNVFQPLAKQAETAVPGGKLAVVFDKNTMEATGYAASMADFCHEQVYLIEYHHNDPDPPVRFVDEVMEIRHEGEWIPIRAAVRYVTQKPWKCIPVCLKTALLNPVVCCLAGGRNKMIAAKAYEFMNATLAGTGLQINTPKTIRDVRLIEIPMWVASLGGKAVVKVPYSNAGQGVYTITSPKELDDFMEDMRKSTDTAYDAFIVQALVGNHKWSSEYYHVGTVPDKQLQTFVCDLRMMVLGTPMGFKPSCMYSRKARIPLSKELKPGETSWDMLGTNLSVKDSAGAWDTETARLALMDRKDFNSLGLGVDDLISAYVQTCLSVAAIDRIAQQLCPPKGGFNLDLFNSFNKDEALIKEIQSCAERPNVSGSSKGVEASLTESSKAAGLEYYVRLQAEARKAAEGQ